MQGKIYPVWLGRLTHLLREAQSHLPPFCLHSQLCKNDARAAYQKNSDAKKLRRIFQVLMKTGPFSEGVNLWSYRTMTFKNGGHCVRALRCHQGRQDNAIRDCTVIWKCLLVDNSLTFSAVVIYDAGPTFKQQLVHARSCLDFDIEKQAILI